MPRLSALLTGIAWGASAMLMLSAASVWAQSPPTLPPGLAESPEFPARLAGAAAGSTIQPWQREFMQGLVRAGAARGAVDTAADAIAAVEGSGDWDPFPPPSPRSDHTAIYDPVRDRMVAFGGYDGSFRNDVWVLSLSGSPAWSALTPAGTLPPDRSGHTAIYDPVRDRMVVFGGQYSGGVWFNDVWVLSLTGPPTWSMLTPTGTPPTARSGHTAIYDPVRDRMIVFGGVIGDNDVWELRLTDPPAWSVLTPTGTLPTARSGHTALYDPVRDRMVVFAGEDGVYRNDVWALSLAGPPVWSVLTPAGTPPTARFGHTAIYDPLRDRMVVFGGYDSGGPRNDVRALSLNGTPAWSALTPAGTLPPSRGEHAGIYDPVRDRMVVFGGSEYDIGLNDIWGLSLGSPPAWSALLPTEILPSARAGHSAIYDPVRDHMVVFGGWTDYGERNDVWVLGLTGSPAWSTLTPEGTLPPARSGHTAIYDPVRDRMIVFMGYGGISDVWALSLAGPPVWSELAPTGVPPTPRQGHTAIYDPVRDRMIVFGGVIGDNDVWELRLTDPPAWSVLTTTGSLPTARSGHTALYDPVRDRMVVFGGVGSGGYMNDVWVLSLAGSPVWSALLPTGTLPSARAGHSAIYDLVRDRMVVFGGRYDLEENDVWALSLAGLPAWNVLTPTGTLPGLAGHTAIHDPVRDRMVVFGGGGGAGVRSDAWGLNWPSLVSVEPPAPPVSPRFELSPPRPNPSRGSVSFEISIPHASPASLLVYDSAGRVVRRVADASFVSGRHVLVWDRRNDDGRLVPSGIYFVRLQAPGVLLTRKTILIQ